MAFGRTVVAGLDVLSALADVTVALTTVADEAVADGVEARLVVARDGGGAGSVTQPGEGVLSVAKSADAKSDEAKSDEAKSDGAKGTIAARSGVLDRLEGLPVISSFLVCSQPRYLRHPGGWVIIPSLCALLHSVACVTRNAACYRMGSARLLHGAGTRSILQALVNPARLQIDQGGVVTNQPIQARKSSQSCRPSQRSQLGRPSRPSQPDRPSPPGKSIQQWCVGWPRTVVDM